MKLKTSVACRAAMARSYHAIMQDVLTILYENGHRGCDNRYRIYFSLKRAYHMGRLTSMSVSKLHDQIWNALHSREAMKHLIKFEKKYGQNRKREQHCSSNTRC